MRSIILMLAVLLSGCSTLTIFMKDCEASLKAQIGECPVIDSRVLISPDAKSQVLVVTTVCVKTESVKTVFIFGHGDKAVEDKIAGIGGSREAYCSASGKAMDVYILNMAISTVLKEAENGR